MILWLILNTGGMLFSRAEVRSMCWGNEVKESGGGQGRRVGGWGSPVKAQMGWWWRWGRPILDGRGLQDHHGHQFCMTLLTWSLKPPPSHCITTLSAFFVVVLNTHNLLCSNWTRHWGHILTRGLMTHLQREWLMVMHQTKEKNPDPKQTAHDAGCTCSNQLHVWQIKNLELRSHSALAFKEKPRWWGHGVM